jgi:hypothetical protein
MRPKGANLPFGRSSYPPDGLAGTVVERKVRREASGRSAVWITLEFEVPRLYPNPRVSYLRTQLEEVG